MLGKTASPTIQQLFSRQAAGPSPGGAKTSSAPAAARVKSVSAKQAKADSSKASVLSKPIQRQISAVAGEAVREGSHEKQHDKHLVEQAAGLLSEVFNSSPAGKAAYQRSVGGQGTRHRERAGQPAGCSATARSQNSSPDEGSAVQQTSGADEQAVDISSPAGKRDGSASMSRSTEMGQNDHFQGSKAWQRQKRKSDRKLPKEPAEVIDLSNC